jgi:hypothetical protein
MPYTEAQKKATYKWRANNREQYNNMLLKYTKKYYTDHLESRREYGKNYNRLRREYDYNVVAKIFLKILR